MLGVRAMNVYRGCTIVNQNGVYAIFKDGRQIHFGAQMEETCHSVIDILIQYGYIDDAEP